MARTAERRRLDFNALARALGRHVPLSAAKLALGRALAGQSVALCLHRVTPTIRPTDWQPGLAIRPEALDALVELLLSARPGPASGWLTVTFDDGYADATAWVAQRARRFPSVEFLCFVCPEKVTARAGFRWDLVEVATRSGLSLADAQRSLRVPMALGQENARAELRSLGDHPDFRLSTVEELREVAALPNVSLGNHTDLHAVATSLAEGVFADEARRAHAGFEQLFGPVRHFAFPFGTPRREFDARHVAVLRRLGDFLLWSTEARAFAPHERHPGAVLPRFPIDGTWPLPEVVGWLTARAWRARAMGSPHAFPR